MILAGYKRLMAGLGPHLVDFIYPAGAVHLNPPPPGGDPWHSFSGVRIALGEGKGGGNRDCSNTPRDPEGVGGYICRHIYIFIY